MKKKVFDTIGAFFLFAVSLANSVQAAELLDVKPIVTGSNVVIEVTADIPMTYTYYNVPGQARAVVDIADADPEKVEPLIVVNNGAVASISVDKAMIGDMTVSRLVFNLVSASEISVNHAPDRKTLNVSFGGGKFVAAPPATNPPASVTVQADVHSPLEPAVPAVVAAEPAVLPAVAGSSKPVSKEEEDPLGLDEPLPAVVPAKDAEPVVVRTTKLEPVVPVTVDQASPSREIVKGIIVGASFIDIQTNGSVEKFKQQRLVKPERLSIEIPGTTTMRVKSIQVKRFGISTVRIGTTPGFVRVVLDTTKTSFPRYEIVSLENGLRVYFK
jgi:AMIN domain